MSTKLSHRQVSDEGNSQWLLHLGMWEETGPEDWRQLCLQDAAETSLSLFGGSHPPRQQETPVGPW